MSANPAPGSSDFQQPAPSTAVSDTEDPRLWAAEGRKQLREGRRTGAHEALGAAEHAFEQVLRLKPDSEIAWGGMAYARLGRHDFEGALTATREAVRRDPNSQSLLALLGDVHFGLGNYMEAENAFRRLADEDINLQSLARLALVLESKGDFEDAEAMMADALEAGYLLKASASDLAWCHSMIGEIAYQHGDLHKAEAGFREALVLDPGLPFAVHGLAEIHTDRGDIKLAAEMMMALVEWLPEPGYLIQTGDLMLKLGKEEEALTYFHMAEVDMLGDLNAGKFGHLRDLAEYWMAHGGDLARAKELALKDLKHVRHDMGAYETAAWACHLNGDTDQATALITEALRQGGGEVRMFERAADIFAQSGNRLRARRCADLAGMRKAVN
ncbi:MAG: hypothetical protein COA70_09395 [Planctomycetota bacterium]|nr:MAG: hypothetical protein COA70_09395 [Planctomycetota bacterium]